MVRTKSSKVWLKEHFDDVYVRRAQKEGYRSRASYKLLEIQDKDHLIKSGQTVVDLGASPGGWSQLVSQIVGSKGKVIASDILSMDNIAGVTFVQGDFTDDVIFHEILTVLGNGHADLVISDMAPNMSGMMATDQPQAMYLAELALDFALQILKKGGFFLVKVFQGEGFDEYLQVLRAQFTKVQTRKPKASRSRSREVYLLAKDFRA